MKRSEQNRKTLWRLFIGSLMLLAITVLIKHSLPAPAAAAPLTAASVIETVL